MVKLVITDSSGLPSHLGGHENETHIDVGTLTYLVEKFGIKSVIDVGCGPGGMVKTGLEMGLDYVGVDGDFTVERDPSIKDCVIIHDFTQEPPLFKNANNEEVFDLGWTVEFLEHVDAHYIYNFMKTLRQCKYVICTHAFPGQPGHHHVNCREHPYWVDIFTAFGFEIDVETTNEVREKSTMVERYIRQQSLVFRNLRLT